MTSLAAPPQAPVFSRAVDCTRGRAGATAGGARGVHAPHASSGRGDTPKYTNRLILETSPYLLQHAHNPVDWFPWGDEAFEGRGGGPAGVPVHRLFTCHWCHVMEEESFEDDEIAAYLNTHYVAVKVDREERPDVDAVYMAAVQALTGRGLADERLLTPDREPFFGGTYFPPRVGARGSRYGFLGILRDFRADLVSERRASAAPPRPGARRQARRWSRRPKPHAEHRAPALDRPAVGAYARSSTTRTAVSGARPSFRRTFPSGCCFARTARTRRRRALLRMAR